jgi:hypothetical protein
MPILLRKFQTFPMMQPDGSMLDVPFATLAFVDEAGNQYAQLNVKADEVEGVSEGDALALMNHSDIDWQATAQRLIDYAETGEAAGPLMTSERVIEIIKSTFERPLEIVKAEPHGLDVPAAHDEMIVG